MGEASHISWTDDTFNGWIGCSKVSPACDGCFAEAMMGENGRYKRVIWGKPGDGAGTRDRTAPSNWAKPLKWNREQAALWAEYDRLVSGCDPANGDNRPDREPPAPRFVFCASLSDVFDNEVPVEWRRDLFQLIADTPHLTWLLLTKRPQMIVKLFDEITDRDQTHDPLSEYWPSNAAIGTSIEDRKRLDLNAPALARAGRALKPAFSFWSCEPLLEDLGDVSHHLGAVDWVIAGGETDQGFGEHKHLARPTPPDAFRSLRDQCAEAAVPFHFKQWGEWAPGENAGGPQTRTQEAGWFDGYTWDISRLTVSEGGDLTSDTEPTVWRVGKGVSGRLLDGREHNARPEVRL